MKPKGDTGSTLRLRSGQALEIEEYFRVQGGSLFDCQMGSFSFDKNSWMRRISRHAVELLVVRWTSLVSIYSSSTTEE